MGLHLFFLTNFPGAMFIQGATFIPDSRVNVYGHVAILKSISSDTVQQKNWAKLR